MGCAFVLLLGLSPGKAIATNVYTPNSGSFDWSADAATLWSTGSKPGTGDAAILGDDGSLGTPLVEATVTTEEMIEQLLMANGAVLNVATGGSLKLNCCSATGGGSVNNAQGYRSEVRVEGGEIRFEEFHLGGEGRTLLQIQSGLFNDTKTGERLELGFDNGSVIVEQTGGFARFSHGLGMGSLSGAGWNGVDRNAWNLSGGALLYNFGLSTTEVNLNNSSGIVLSDRGALYIHGDYTSDPTLGGIVSGANGVAFGVFYVGGIQFNEMTRLTAAANYDPTDTDGDGDVDTADITTMFQNFTGPVGLAGEKSMMLGDADLDGDVDTADITLGYQHFTGAIDASLGVTQPVPEPGGLVLLALGLVGLGMGRRWGIFLGSPGCSQPGPAQPARGTGCSPVSGATKNRPALAASCLL